MKLRYLLIALCVCHAIDYSWESEESEGKEHDVFVPTSEWQVVKKGQKIPKGLHVRINFETGITEAKLLDKSEEENNKLNAITVPNNIDYVNDIGKIQSNNKPKTKTKFKSYEEIKDELKEANIVPKTDAELLIGLLENYQDSQSDDSRLLEILEDLEYLAHKFDNALEFVKQEGFKKVLNVSLSSNNEKVVSQTLILMGSLAQNNPTVQIHAMKTGFLNILQRLLADKRSVVKNRSMFALGSILRGFPWAQLKFVETGGVAILLNCMESNDLNLESKTITLLDDLIMEYEFSKLGDISEEKLSQYESVDIKNKLVEQGYCGGLMRVALNGLVDPSFDKGIVGKAIESVCDDCAALYSKDKLWNSLKQMKEKIEDDKTKYVDLILSNVRKPNKVKERNKLRRQDNVKEEL